MNKEKQVLTDKKEKESKTKKSYKRKKCEKVKRERCDLAHAENKFARHFYSFCKKELEKEELKR